MAQTAEQHSGPFSGQPEHPGLLPADLTHDGETDPSRRSGRDWFVDVSGVLWSLGIGAVIYFTTPRNHAWLGVADVVLGVICCVAIFWRRRWPVQLAVAMSVVSVISSFGSVAATIALFTVAVRRPTRVLVPVAGLSLLCSEIFVVLRPDADLPIWISWLLSAVITMAVVAWGMFVRARRQLVFSLRERAQRAEAEQQLRISQARQLERARIAREMHDVLAHRISLVSLHAGALEFRSRAAGEDVAKSAAVIRDAAHQALEDLREVIGVLRADTGGDDEDRPQPSLGDLSRLVVESQEAGMRVTSTVEVDEQESLPLSVGRTAYRIVQEGLTNARKHAPGAAVSVRLTGGPGPGLDVEVLSRRSMAATVIPGAGQGLVGLSERAGLAGGKLEHGRTPEGDFRLKAWLPWPA